MGKRKEEDSNLEVQVAESMEERAARFFEEQPSYEGLTIYVASTNDVFLGDIKGRNQLDNFITSKKEQGVTFKEFSRPQ